MICRQSLIRDDLNGPRARFIPGFLGVISFMVGSELFNRRGRRGRRGREEGDE